MHSYKEAEQVAKEIDKKLSAYDFNPYSLTEIIHEEGTILHYRSAFAKEWQDWIFVFTEHHGTHVYHKSDLYSWGTYVRKDGEKLEGTGYVDKCEFCQRQFKVEELCYSKTHPDLLEHDDDKYWIYCDDCNDIVGSEHEDLWRHLNKTDWGFTWGRDDMDHIKKACATIMMEDCIDKWLDTPSPSFRKTPRKAIEHGDYEDVYLAIYSMGTGEFS